MMDVGIGLLGIGTVGGGVLKIHRQNRTGLEAKAGCRLTISAVADRDITTPRPGLTLGHLPVGPERQVRRDLDGAPVAVEEAEPVPGAAVLARAGIVDHPRLGMPAHPFGVRLHLGGRLDREADRVDARLLGLPQPEHVGLRTAGAEIQALAVPVHLLEPPAS